MNWESFENRIKKIRYNKLKGDKWLDASCSFDIETSRVGDVSFMYLWGFSFFNEFFEIGRTWEEFLEFFDKLEQVLEKNRLNLIIYVHNLNFEYSFMNQFLDQRIKKYFAKGECDILYFMTNHTWWRCSAKLTRLNLERSCKMYNTKHQKLVGDLDYDVVRYPSTEIPEDSKEMKYFMHDLICVNEVVEAVKELKDAKSILQMPMTLTGFNRRKAKKRCESVDYHMNYRTLRIDNEIYSLAEDSQKGGAVECSMFKKNKILKSDGWDYNGQHPWIILTGYFPMNRFVKFPGDENNMEAVYKELETKCCLFDIVFESVELKKDKDFGIIGISHIQNRKDCKVDVVIDYRIIKATNVHLTLNEIDFKNILKFYDVGDFKIWNLYTARRARLPYQIRDVVWESYLEKLKYSKYKNTDLEWMYNNKKQELNSFSGMLQTKTVHPEWRKQSNGTFKPYELSNSDKYHFLSQYSESYAHFVYYPWGNWIISQSRYWCYRLIDCAKPGKHIYHDTDSCYAEEFDMKKIKALNKEIEAISEKYGYNVGRLGQADLEHKDIEFKMLGIKSYAIKEDGVVKTTVAGLPKEYASVLNGDLNNFHLGTLFPGAMKTATYHTHEIYKLTDDKGNEFSSAGYCTIKNEDFILKNMDSKYELLTGYIYSDI